MFGMWLRIYNNSFQSLFQPFLIIYHRTKVWLGIIRENFTYITLELQIILSNTVWGIKNGDNNVRRFITFS